MEVWNVFENQTTLGVEVKIIALPKFPLVAASIGEEGRGRELTLIPIDLLPESSAELRSRGSVLLKHAELAETRSGKPKLREWKHSKDDSFLVFLRTPFGFRGSNAHTGDFDAEGNLLPFPGQVIARGHIADGDAGRMAYGEHLLAVMPKRTVFRAQITGRRYGRPEEYFYYHTGDTLLAFTHDERKAADLF